MARQHILKVTLTADELTRLDELRPPGTSRPAFLRGLLREPPRDAEVATRTEALPILTAQARDGRVAAAIALERALRHEAGAAPDALDDILGRDVSEVKRFTRFCEKSSPCTWSRSASHRSPSSTRRCGPGCSSAGMPGS